MKLRCDAAFFVWLIGLPLALFYPDFQDYNGSLKWNDRYLNEWNKMVIRSNRGDSRAYEMLKSWEETAARHDPNVRRAMETSGPIEPAETVPSEIKWQIRSRCAANAAGPLFILWLLVRIFCDTYKKKEK